MRQSKNHSSHTLASIALKLLGIVSIAWTLSASACVKLPIPPPTQPGFSLGQGKIYVQYNRSVGGSSLAAFRADTGTFLWQGSGSLYTSLPVTDTTTVFTQKATTLLARNAQNGTERWHTSEGMAPEAVLNGIVYATSYKGATGTQGPAISLSALRASDGSQLWTTAYFSGSSEVVQLAVEQGHMYLLTDAGFFVLQADDGKLLWSSTPIGSGSSFTIANEIIYLNRGSNKGLGGLDAIEANSGHLLWTFRANDISPSPPILTSDGILCVETGVDEPGVQGELYGLRARDGVQLWKRSGKFLNGTIATADGVIYVSSVDKGLVAVQAQDGKERWQFHPSEASGTSASSLVHLDEKSAVIYTTLGSSVVEVQTNGSLLRKIPVSSADQSSYQEVDGVIYQLIPAGMVEVSNQQYWTRIDLTATRGRDGKLLWSTHFRF